MARFCEENLLPDRGSFASVPAMFIFVVFYASPSQVEGGHGFPDLLFVACILRGKLPFPARARHQFAQGFRHESSPLFDCRRFGKNGRILIQRISSTIWI